MSSKGQHVIVISAPGIDHRMAVSDREDENILMLVVRKVMKDAARAIPRYLPVPSSHYLQRVDQP
jgi:hypothetical protein